MKELFNTINEKDSKLLKKPYKIKKDKFWYNNPSILINYERLSEFFPTSDMTIEEQLNSAVRLSFYLSITLFLYKKNVNYFYIGIVSLIFTYLIYTNSDSNKYIEKFSDITKKKYVKPTVNNPFMNILPDDYLKNPNREAINKINNYINPKINNLIDSKFNYNLYRDVNDVFNRNPSQRQFYTMPVTTIPNEQGKFAKWLYGNSKSCKEGNGSKCVSNLYENLKQSSAIRNGLID